MQKSTARYVLDSYALQVYFKRQPGWQEVVRLLGEAAATGENLLLNLINWGEVYYTTLKENGQSSVREVDDAIGSMPITIYAPDREMTVQAAKFKALGGIAYSDCFAASLAVIENAAVVTGDREFEKLEDLGLLKVHWI